MKDCNEGRWRRQKCDTGSWQAQMDQGVVRQFSVTPRLITAGLSEFRSLLMAARELQLATCALEEVPP